MNKLKNFLKTEFPGLDLETTTEWFKRLMSWKNITPLREDYVVKTLTEEIIGKGKKEEFKSIINDWAKFKDR